MRLIIVRHGETFANERGIACGQDNNSGLNEVGKLQAKKLSVRLLFKLYCDVKHYDKHLFVVRPHYDKSW